MNEHNHEIEIKIKVSGPEGLKKKILGLGGMPGIKGEQHDTMYDDGKGFFEGTSSTPPRVLRLRKNLGLNNKLTYKELLPDLKHEFMLQRVEIETIVSDYDATDAIIKKLGFIPYRIKEKKYEDYELDGLRVEFHTLPFLGEFIEIEALEKELENFLPKIGFGIRDGINEDYTGLFEAFCTERALSKATPQTFEEEKKFNLSSTIK